MGKFNYPIAIDFQGVVAEYHGYRGEGIYEKPMNGAKEFLQKLKDVDIEFNIFTTEPTKKVIEWMKKYKMPMPVKVTNVKEPAPVYIDDRVIKFNGDFGKLIKDMKDFNVYWKSDKIFKDLL